MSRGLVAVALLLGLAACEGGATSPSRVSTTLETIDCTASYITVSTSGSYTCSQYGKRTATSDDSGHSVFQVFNIRGTTDDHLIVNAQVNKALARGLFRPQAVDDDAYRAEIQSFNDLTRSGQDWSPVQNRQGTRLMSFADTQKRACFGFLAFGGLANQGFDHYIRGYFCRGAANLAAFTDDEMIVLVNRITVRDRLG